MAMVLRGLFYIYSEPPPVRAPAPAPAAPAPAPPAARCASATSASRRRCWRTVAAAVQRARAPAVALDAAGAAGAAAAGASSSELCCMRSRNPRRPGAKTRSRILWRLEKSAPRPTIAPDSIARSRSITQFACSAEGKRLPSLIHRSAIWRRSASCLSGPFNP